MGSSGSGRPHRLDALLRQLGTDRPLSADPGGRDRRRGGAGSVPRRPGHAEAHRRREVVHGQGRRRLLARQRTRRRRGGLDRRNPHDRGRPLPRSASADQEVQRQAEPVPVRLRGGRRRRLSGRLRRHRRAWRTGKGGRVQGCGRRLFRHHGHGPGRPPGRGLRRAAAQGGPHPALGLCSRRTDLGSGSDRRKVSGHPPRTRLSGPARSHGEGHPVPSARRRRQRRDGVDGKLRHDPARLGQRPLLRPSGQPLFRRRQDRPRPDRGLRRPQGLGGGDGRALAGADPQL
uniref:LigA n=1 Tax=Parastrongyloides trichosuri TaxID=131310 RepID=A0A0N4ZXP5_PARTI